MKISLVSCVITSPSRMQDQWSISVSIDTRDLWVGLFWDRDIYGYRHFYVCPIPGLVIHYRTYRGR